jgi:hypothetical protein
MKKQSNFDYYDARLSGDAEDDPLLHDENSSEGIQNKGRDNGGSCPVPPPGESTSTSVTGGDSYSEEETGWLVGIGADFRTLAMTLRETAGGVVSFVHRSAINVANEIALLEEEDYLAAASDESNSGNCEPLHLPWEIKKNVEGEYAESEELKKRILDLSMRESNFMKPVSSRTTKNEDEEDDDFVLDNARVQIIRHLLKVDPQLSAMHARLSGRSDVRETTFWRNYFYACGETRRAFVEEQLEELCHDGNEQQLTAFSKFLHSRRRR